MAELLFRKFIYTILEKLIPTEKCHHHRNQKSNERGDKKTTKKFFVFNFLIQPKGVSFWQAKFVDITML